MRAVTDLDPALAPRSFDAMIGVRRIDITANELSKTSASGRVHRELRPSLLSHFGKFLHDNERFSTYSFGMNERPDLQCFPATHAAAIARIAAVDVERYAASRNALAGAVSGLSPYITHGIVTTHQVLAAVASRQPIGIHHKFVAELGWRSYYRHVWQHRGDAIFQSLHQGLLPDASYGTSIPDDVRYACSGVPVIDQAVRQLYVSGYLHNHARLWLASYLVHVRKVHWRAGADWLYSHLLDGDLASNHLSWQWVAGTGSRKPYLFNAENVERFASLPWHSRGTAIDTDYDALDALARDANRHVAEYGNHGAGIAEPQASSLPPDDIASAPEPGQVAGRDVWLVHPWALREPSRHLPPGCVRLGIVVSDFHSRWPWSEHRWRFVGEAMLATTDQCWHGDMNSIGEALRQARSVHSITEPHLREYLPRIAHTEADAALFPEVDQLCHSFSQWWSHVTKNLRQATELFGAVEN